MPRRSGPNRCARRAVAGTITLGLAATLAACDQPQSALLPAGRQAEELGTLFYVMTFGAVVIWVIVLGTTIAATLGYFRNADSRAANVVIIGGGVIFPTIVLALLLTYGLGLLPNWQPDPDRLRVHVHGEQYWWRVAYEVPGQSERVISANEIHLPAGEPVEFVLTSADVIHSFWIPSIGGKLDMIPGRETRLVLEAEKPGIYRGVCAEYCGTSHANMAFAAVVHEPEAFDAFLNERTRDATIEDSHRGADLFQASGCAACHRIAGFAEQGTVGPDLTHFGSRHTLGAGIAANTPENIAAWIADPALEKPGVQMPGYAMLPGEDIEAIATFLSDLK